MGKNETSKSSGIERLAFLNLYVRQICLAEGSDLGLDLLLRLFRRRDFDVVEVSPAAEAEEEVEAEVGPLGEADLADVEIEES